MLDKKNIFNTSQSILQTFDSPFLKGKGVKLFVKRDDLIHPLVSGNKWRKLKYNIAQAFKNKADGVITFGGAYSNHLIATASACNKVGLKSVGLVRGEELHPDSNETLKKCSLMGMKLVFLDRMVYAMKNDVDFIKELHADYPNYYLVPEGGANFLGMIGCQEIWNEIPFVPDHVFVAQGTTATSVGLLLGKKESTALHVVPVLKGFDSQKEMLNLLNKVTFDSSISGDYLSKVIFHADADFGGYAKYNDELIDFIRKTYRNHLLPLDHVYTGKAFYSLIKWLEKQNQLEGKTIVFIHTGGLQGSSFYQSDF